MFAKTKVSEHPVSLILKWAFQQVLFELVSRDCTAPSHLTNFSGGGLFSKPKRPILLPVSVDRSETDSDEEESPNGSFASFDRKQAEASR